MGRRVEGARCVLIKQAYSGPVPVRSVEGPALSPRRSHVVLRMKVLPMFEKFKE